MSYHSRMVLTVSFLSGHLALTGKGALALTRSGRAYTSIPQFKVKVDYRSFHLNEISSTTTLLTTPTASSRCFLTSNSGSWSSLTVLSDWSSLPEPTDSLTSIIKQPLPSGRVSFLLYFQKANRNSDTIR